VSGPEGNRLEARLHSAATLRILNVLSTLLRVVLEEIELDGHIADVLAECGCRISSVLIVDDPNVSDNAPPTGTDLGDHLGVMLRRADLR